MARVPTYEDLTVAPRPISGTEVADVQPGNAALRMGAALGQAADVTNAVAQKEQNLRDADRLFQAEGALKNDYLQFEQGMKQRTGQNAWGVAQDAAQWWDKAIAKYTDGLENPNQRRLFAQTSAGLRLQGLHTAGEWEQQQRKVSLEESAKSSISTSIGMAAANATDDNALGAAKSDVLDRLRVLGGLNGWTPEIAAAQRNEALTKLHTQVIQQLVDTAPDKAQTYLDANRGEIDGSVHAELDKLVKSGTQSRQAQTAVDDIMGRKLDEAGALAYARKTYSGELEDSVVTRVKAQYAERHQQVEQGRQDLNNQGWDVYERVKSVAAMPPSLWARLPGQTKRAIEQADKERLGGDAVHTDWSKFYELKQTAATDPAAFNKLDLRESFPSLAPSERRTLIDMQTSTKTPAGAEQVATLQQQLATVHNTLGWNEADASAKKGQFDATAYRALDQAAKEKGKALTYEERQKVLDRLVIDGEVVSGHWYMNDPNVKLYEVLGTEDARSFVPTIPDQDRKDIEAALGRAKLPVTPERVMQLYKRKHGLP